MAIELDTTLAQAEVLFLSFQQLVADMDRRRIEQHSSAPTADRLRHRKGGSKSQVAYPELSGELRELLVDRRVS
jgi:hypothetical protein